MEIIGYWAKLYQEPNQTYTNRVILGKMWYLHNTYENETRQMNRKK